MMSTLVSAKNIVVLTSLPGSQLKTTKRLNKIIKRKLSHFSNLNLIVVNRGDQEVLHNYLNDPETVALFWLSHGGYKTLRSNDLGMMPSALLLDFNGDNVSKVFQKIHPNIKFLGIIGCNSSQILSPYLSMNKEVGSYIPTKKVVATWAMRKAIRKFKKHYSQNNYESITRPIEKKGYEITIKRISKTASKSLKVFAGKEFIGIIPKSKKNEFQEKIFFIPAVKMQKRKMKITFESGQSAFDATDNFGDISLMHNQATFWKLFSKRDGTPFGTNERIYLFKSDISQLIEAENYILYKE